jgi:hypothetical protein
MLRPILFIGLGGAGGKTLRAIKQQLQQDLVAKGYSESLPTAWQFLHIDTSTVQDGASFPAPMLLAEEYYSVVPSGITLKDIIRKVESLGPQLELQKMLAGWCPELPPISINTSAGQFRAVGRLALVADLRNTFDVIQKAISKMLSPTAIPELQAVASTLGVALDESTPQVFIISSLGGGTGSGMFTDVAELVKRATQEEWGDRAISILYTPDVFRSLGSMGKAISSNSFAAMNELLAGEGTELSGSTDLLYIKSGIPFKQAQRENTFGSKTNILVGSDSGEIYENILDFGTRFAKAIAQGEISEFILNLISIHNSQSKISGSATGLATGLLTYDDNTLLKSEEIFPLWSNPVLTYSILSEVEQSKLNAQTWNHFWKGRRVRSLPESIPLSGEMLRSMIAGWFIAPLFGLRKVDYGQSGPTVKVWNPTLDQPDWSSFPDPLLAADSADKSRQGLVLPQVLASTGLALIKFGLTGDPTVINGYRLLNHLGSEVNSKVNQTRGERDRKVKISWEQRGRSTYISDWIQTEVRPANELELSKSLAEVHGGTPMERAQAIYSTVERIREHYSQMWKEFEDKPWHQMPETWELREEIDLALQDIGDYVKGFYN